MYGHQQGLKPPEDRMVKLCRNDSPYIPNYPLHKQHNNTHHPSPAQTCSQISWAESSSFASQGHASGAFVFLLIWTWTAPPVATGGDTDTLIQCWTSPAQCWTSPIQHLLMSCLQHLTPTSMILVLPHPYWATSVTTPPMQMTSHPLLHLYHRCHWCMIWGHKLLP